MTRPPDPAVENLLSPGVIGIAGNDLPPVATDIDPIRYEGLCLPSFSLGPVRVENLRIVHGSCRKAHGESYDAMPAVDTMLLVDASDPEHRPHQLFLTGDQIYADDVPDLLLLEVRHTADWLFQQTDGNVEKIPLRQGELANPRADTRRPGLRGALVRQQAKFTTDPVHSESHLLSFAEYCTYYLYHWSQVLWPQSMPNRIHLYPELNGPNPLNLSEETIERLEEREEKLSDLWGPDLMKFHKFGDIFKVRRALANIPTYMILDDHEITDDFFINRRWCQDVLANPAGNRIVSNGMLAYALFQAWGNTPDQFDALNSPGAPLLANITQLNQNQAARDQCRAAVGIPDVPLFQGENMVKPPGSLDWHYHIQWRHHEAIVLDLRTRRGYPNGVRDPIANIKAISDESLADQIPPQWTGDLALTLLVSSVPVFGNPIIEAAQAGVSTEAQRLSRDAESWPLVPHQIERLLGRLVTRQKQGEPALTPPPVVILSGDVHFGFTQRITYHARQPYPESLGFPPPTPRSVDMVFAQLNSSGFKNETSSRSGCCPPTYTHKLHAKGYDIGLLALLTGWFDPGLPDPVLTYGWNQILAPIHLQGDWDLPWRSFAEYIADARDPYSLLKPVGQKQTGDPDFPLTVIRSAAFPDGRLVVPADWYYKVEFLLADISDVNDPGDAARAAVSPLRPPRDVAGRPMQPFTSISILPGSGTTTIVRGWARKSSASTMWARSSFSWMPTTISM